MKKLLLILFLTGCLFADIKYYADIRLSDGFVNSSYSDVEVLENIDRNLYVRIEITQQEYESGSIDQAKIDSGVASGEAYLKDVNNISKLEKCGFLVIMDYLRLLGLSKTNVDFKNDVITKYDS